MNRRHVLFVVAGCVLAAALMLLNRHTNEPGCAQSGSCAEVAPDARSVAPPPPAAPQKTAAEPASVTAPVDAQALRDEADRLIAEGKVLEGVKMFRKAVEADPSAKNHGDLGTLLYKLQVLDEAGIHLRAAADLDPSNADRWIALANLYYRKTDPGEAWKAERRAREAEPGLQLGRDNEGMRVRK